MSSKYRRKRWRESGPKHLRRKRLRLVKALVAGAMAIFGPPNRTRLLLNELAKIQPLDRPEGKIFYLDRYEREETKK